MLTHLSIVSSFPPSMLPSAFVGESDTCLEGRRGLDYVATHHRSRNYGSLPLVFPSAALRARTPSCQETKDKHHFRHTIYCKQCPGASLYIHPHCKATLQLSDPAPDVVALPIPPAGRLIRKPALSEPPNSALSFPRIRIPQFPALPLHQRAIPCSRVPKRKSNVMSLFPGGGAANNPVSSRITTCYHPSSEYITSVSSPLMPSGGGSRLAPGPRITRV